MRVSLSDFLYWLGVAIVVFNILAAFRLFFVYNLCIGTSWPKKVLGGLAFVLFALFSIKECEWLMDWPLSLITYAITSGLLLQFVIFRQNEIDKNSMELLRAIVGVIEAGDPNLDGHSLNVQNLSLLLYDHLPISYRFRVNPKDLSYASLLLDVGKLGIPRSVIDKPGKLDNDEWMLMKRHPEIGMKILEPIASMSGVREMIKYHHERVDGSGYYQRKDKDIPLGSRIIAVADTYSAITMNRSYKASLSFEDAMLELRLSASSQLDPNLVDIFCTIPIRKVKASIEDAKKVMERYEGENFRK